MPSSVLMLKAQKGSSKMQHHTDWPVFLYDATEYDKTNPESGLFKNWALVLILRHILIGPSAARILDINGYLIAYAACQARFMLNAQMEWTRMDGKFDSSAFYDWITHYFKTGAEQGDANVDELLKWYKNEVFNNSGLLGGDEDSESDSDSNEDGSDSGDEDTLIQRQRELQRTQHTNAGEPTTGATANAGRPIGYETNNGDQGTGPGTGATTSGVVGDTGASGTTGTTT
ncbi:hypothetical protein EYR40_002516 [Pleurotus pulmonarius]|nr:hypothetical protein EYR40_002516 [Pleurotus pulmonarius]